MMQWLLAALATVWSVILLGAGALAWHFYRRESRRRRQEPARERVVLTGSVRSVAGRQGRRERKIVF